MNKLRKILLTIAIMMTLGVGGVYASGGNVVETVSNIFDSIQLNISFTPSSIVEGLFWWNEDDKTINIATGDENDPILQVNQETVIIAYNATASVIPNGSVVHPVGGATDGRPHVELAQADSHSELDRDIWVTTQDIGTSTDGFVTKFGKVRSVDTSMFTAGDNLWVGTTTPGSITNSEPAFPDYSIQVGGVATSSASAGEIVVDVIGRLEDTFNDFYVRNFREQFDFTVASDGITVVGTLAPSDGHPDMTMIFSDGFSTFDTSPNATTTLTSGTASTTQMNYVYIPQDTKALTVSTSDWPAGEHIRVATIGLLSAEETQANDSLLNQNWNNYVQDTENKGQLFRILERMRQDDAKHDSGTEGLVTITDLATDDVELSTTGGVVYQIGPQTVGAFDMANGDEAYVVNDPVSAYATTTNINTMTTDALGVTLANTSFSIVAYGVNNKSGEQSQTMLNLPICKYLKNNPDNAVQDGSNCAVYDVPSIFKSTAYYIARFTFILEADGVSWTLYSTQDLRGRAMNAVGGGGAGGSGVTSFTALTDTPPSYTGLAGYVLTPNSAETALEFVALSGGSTFGGTGADGALDTSGGTVNIDLGGSSFFIKNYTSINVVTNSLTFSNPHADGTVIALKSQGNVVISDTIDASGMGGAGGASKLAGGEGGGAIFASYGGIGGNSASAGGPNGARTVSTDSNIYGLSIAGKSIPMAAGAGGGGGGEGFGVPVVAGGAGGDGGAALVIECGGDLNFTGIINVSGDDGVVGTVGNGNSGGGGGGGGGDGGTFAIIYNTLTSSAGTKTVSGGNGGNGGVGVWGGTTRHSGSGGGGAGHLSTGGYGGAGLEVANGENGESSPSGGTGGTGGVAVGGNGGGGGGGGGSDGGYYIMLNTEF